MLFFYTQILEVYFNSVLVIHVCLFFFQDRVSLKSMLLNHMIITVSFNAFPSSLGEN